MVRARPRLHGSTDALPLPHRRRLESARSASRYNPFDVHGASEVIAAGDFEWHDTGWKGRPWQEAVIYELHVGTFTGEGIYAASRGDSIISQRSA